MELLLITIAAIATIVMSYCLFAIISMHQKEIEAIFKAYDDGMRQIIELQMEILSKEK